MIQDARGWCTGMTQRDGMGRELGAAFRMGNMCTRKKQLETSESKNLKSCLSDSESRHFHLTLQENIEKTTKHMVMIY